MKKTILIAALMILTLGVFAQGGRRNQERPNRGRPNAGQRIQMEKDSVIGKITTLSEDQKMLLDAVYAGVQTSMEELAGTARDDREGFREKMRAISEDKNAQVKEILNEEQWTQYEAMLKEAREQRRERRQNGGQRRGRPDGGQ